MSSLTSRKIKNKFSKLIVKIMKIKNELVKLKN